MTHTRISKMDKSKVKKASLDISARKTASQRGDVNNRFRSFLYNSILQNEENRLARLVSATNYPTDEKPITMNSLTNSLFANFLYRQPVSDNMTTDAYMRTAEMQTMIPS